MQGDVRRTDRASGADAAARVDYLLTPVPERSGGSSIHLARRAAPGVLEVGGAHAREAGTAAARRPGRSDLLGSGPRKNRRSYMVLNATDMASSVFSFNQDQFDLICDSFSQTRSYRTGANTVDGDDVPGAKVNRERTSQTDDSGLRHDVRVARPITPSGSSPTRTIGRYGAPPPLFVPEPPNFCIC
jgi:hypothetical protein